MSHDIRPHRKALPLITKDKPAFEVSGGWRPTADALNEALIVDDWRMYDRRLTGVVLSEDGKPLRPIVETLPGIIVKLFVRGGWVLMDDKKLYKLGLRSYPGT